MPENYPIYQHSDEPKRHEYTYTALRSEDYDFLAEMARAMDVDVADALNLVIEGWKRADK